MTVTNIRQNAESLQALPAPQICAKLNRRQLAEQFGISERLLSDAAYVMRHGSAALIAQVKDGRITIHKALRLLGRKAQGDRNDAKLQRTLNLCAAVLDEDYERAKIIAAVIVIDYDSKKRQSGLSLQRRAAKC